MSARQHLFLICSLDLALTAQGMLPEPLRDREERGKREREYFILWVIMTWVTEWLEHME